MTTRIDKMIKIIYHGCIQMEYPRCIAIIDEHMQAIIQSGLYDQCDMIHMMIATDMDPVSVSSFLERYGRKIRVTIQPKTWVERDTLLAAFDMIDPNDQILFLHSKGITRRGREGDFVDDWRRMMNYFLISKHIECRDHLSKGIDTIGVNYEPFPAPHFSGNFWWVRGEYFLSLPREIGTDKYDPEVHFLFKNNPKYVNLHHSKVHHYKTPYPPRNYVDDDAI